MVTHTAKVFGVVLALLALTSAAPRSTRSLEPPGYQPPCNCHTEQQSVVNETSQNEYLPPVENSQSSSNAVAENEVPTERNLEYLPPLELGPVVGVPAEVPEQKAQEQVPEEKTQQQEPENEANAGGNLAENQAPENPAEAQEYLPPDNTQQTAEQNDGSASLKLEDGGSQAEAVADGEITQVSACVNGRCEEKQSRAEPEGYSYPKPAAPFELPTVEIARTVDEEIPNESGCNSCGKKRSTREVVATATSSVVATATGGKSKREAARISSVSTDPSTGPVRISTLPFLVTKNARQESTDYQVVRNRRDVTAQTKPAKVGTAQTLPAKIGTAQTLPAKIGTAQALPAKTGSAQSLPGRHRREQPKAQTLPAKIGTAQTLPAKIGTAQTLPAKTGAAQPLPGRHRRDTKKSTYPSQKDQPKAQTLPAKIGTAQTLPAKIGTAQTLPAKIN